MGLNLAHKGYEYQDLLTVYFILNETRIQVNNATAL